jgi:hypothetical protein
LQTFGPVKHDPARPGRPSSSPTASSCKGKKKSPTQHSAIVIHSPGRRRIFSVGRSFAVPCCLATTSTGRRGGRK